MSDANSPKAKPATTNRCTRSGDYILNPTNPMMILHRSEAIMANQMTKLESRNVFRVCRGYGSREADCCSMRRDTL